MTPAELRELTARLSLDLHEITEPAGAGFLTLTTLRDLDSTIDQMFDELQKLNRPELLDSLCPYFGVIWPSARALTQVVDHTLIPGMQATHDLKILELGCGLALPSLLAAQRGSQVWATDFHPQVERFLSINRERNQASTLRYVDWDWKTRSNETETNSASNPNLPQELRQIWGKADWVIASDVLYDAELPVPLAQAMSQAIHSRGRITLTDPGRPYLQRFCDELTKKQGFRQETEVLRVRHPQNEQPHNTQDIFVLHFSRK